MGNKFKIHMADDDQRHCQIYEISLREELDNVDIEFSHDGEATLAACLTAPYPDLIVLDIDMPKMRGDEVLRELKQKPAFKDIPIIILTGNTDMTQQMELLELGAEDFIGKGASPGIFLARIRAQMRHRLALNRLEQLASDRDMFAAGVLHDIKNIESVLVELCQDVKKKISKGPIENKDLITEDLDKLRVHSKSLGAYASDVIQSVRESGKKAEQIPVDLNTILDWTLDVLEEKLKGSRSITCTATDGLLKVIGDEKFSRLVVLSLVQHAQKLLPDGANLSIVVNQRDHKDGNHRANLVTSIITNCPKDGDSDLANLFKISEYGSSVEELGMPMVARLMQNMGGRVWAESNDQSGLIFNIELAKA